MPSEHSNRCLLFDVVERRVDGMLFARRVAGQDIQWDTSVN